MRMTCAITKPSISKTLQNPGFLYRIFGWEPLPPKHEYAHFWHLVGGNTVILSGRSGVGKLDFTDLMVQCGRF